MLVKKSIEQFSEVLASDAPAPGGGSVAALSGALGADLVAMVCALSIGKEGFEKYRDQLIAAQAEARDLSASLLERVDLDTQAFNGVMAAFRLPKGSDDEKRARSEAIQKGYKQAIQSPLDIARECVETLQLAETLLGRSNGNALSDLGVSAQQACAGLEGAIMNVKINLPSIKDSGFVAETRARIEELLGDGRSAAEAVHAYVTAELG